jgi:AAA+ ATPase superfamily predicted ATPase
MATEVSGQQRAEIHLDRDHPWPGLISFTEADVSFFFGRKREVAELARMVRQETATVFFGKSGLGKSSILRAGVSPLLRDSEFVPIYIRLNHAEGAPPLEDQVEIRFEETFAEEKIEAPRPVRAETLWEYFHKKDLRLVGLQ